MDMSDSVSESLASEKKAFVVTGAKSSTIIRGAKPVGSMISTTVDTEPNVSASESDVPRSISYEGESGDEESSAPCGFQSGG